MTIAKQIAALKNNLVVYQQKKDDIIKELTKQEKKECNYSLKREVFKYDQLINSALYTINTLEQSVIQEKANNLIHKWNASAEKRITCYCFIWTSNSNKRTSAFCQSILLECDELLIRKSNLVSEYTLLSQFNDTDYKNYVADATPLLATVPITSSVLTKQDAVFFRRYFREEKESRDIQIKYEEFHESIQKLQADVSLFMEAQQTELSTITTPLRQNNL